MTRILYAVAGALTALFIVTFTAGWSDAAEQMGTPPATGGSSSLNTLVACAIVVLAVRYGWRRVTARA